MNKKFLSAILFGALMITSTGTFVSCKDYDDDIENLQTQIDANAKSIADLKASLDGANYVTSVTVSGNNLVVTTKNGGSTTIALPEHEDEVGSMVSVNADGYLVIDGEVTDIKACEAKEEGEFLAPVKIEGGEWMVLQEDGTYAPLGLKASSVAVSGDKVNGYVLTVTDGEGNETKIELPTAASSLTDLDVIGNEYSDATADLTTLDYTTYRFNYSGTGKPKNADWKGPRGTVPANGYIFAQTNEILAQINPTSVDGADLNLKLVDSQNNNPSGVQFVTTAHTALQTRAANANGMYTLAMGDVYFSDNQYYSAAAFADQFYYYETAKEYALTAGGTVRSAYTIAAKATQNINVDSIQVYDGWTAIVNNGVAAKVDYKNANASTPESATADATIDLNKWYQVNAFDAKYNEAGLWDMNLDVNSDYVTLYGIEFKEEVGSWYFRATKTPDNITKAAFPLDVETIAKDGSYNKATFVVAISSLISSGVTYDLVNHLLSENNSNPAYEKNFFSVDLSKLKNSMNASELAVFNIQADTINAVIKNIYGNVVAACDTAGIKPILVKELKANKKDNMGKEAGKPSEASNVVFFIDNDEAAEDLGTAAAYNGDTYYMVIDFVDANGNKLSQITVPFKLTLPAISTMFEIPAGYKNADGVVNLYMYADDFKKTKGTGASTFNLSRVFSKFSTNGYYVALDEWTNVGSTNKKSSQLAELCTTVTPISALGKSSTIDAGLAHLTLTGDLGQEPGYAQNLKLYIGGYFDNAWTYNDATFNFEVKMMSPIAEGKVLPKEGNTVTLTAANKDAQLGGYKLNNSHITGITYNSAEKYNVLPDVVSDPAGSLDWSRADIDALEAEPGDNNQYFTVSAATAASWVDAADHSKGINEGYFLLKGNNLTNTVESTLKVKVTDIWKRSVTSTVPVKITVE